MLIGLLLKLYFLGKNGWQPSAVVSSRGHGVKLKCPICISGQTRVYAP